MLKWAMRIAALGAALLADPPPRVGLGDLVGGDCRVARLGMAADWTEGSHAVPFSCNTRHPPQPPHAGIVLYLRQRGERHALDRAVATWRCMVGI